jgi:hypothetical protein
MVLEINKQGAKKPPVLRSISVPWVAHSRSYIFGPLIFLVRVTSGTLLLYSVLGFVCVSRGSVWILPSAEAAWGREAWMVSAFRKFFVDLPDMLSAISRR